MALVKVDATGLHKALLKLRDTVGGDARAMIDTEMAMLLETLAAATTKPGKQSKRISRDFKRAFRYDNKRGDASVDLQELYRTLDSFGKYGRKKPTLAKAVITAQRQHEHNIGFMGAGWLGGGNPTGARAPAAVRKHKPVGMFHKVDTAGKYVLTSTNKVGFLAHFKGMTIIIQKAINKRAASIRSNIRMITAGKKTYQYRK